jgi:hypothetical protein
MWTFALPLLSILAGTPIFERVELVEMRSGVTRLRTVQAPVLEVPDEQGREPGAWREARFSRLYAIEFELETRGPHRSQLEERGEIFLAARAGSDDLQALDERIRSLLASFGADSFTQPLAGIQVRSPAFLGLAEISVEPSWVCSVPGGRGSLDYTTLYHRQTEEAPDGQTRVVGTGSASMGIEPSRRICEGLRQAAKGATPEELRTLPLPRALHELAVVLDEADTLPKEVRRQDLPPLPPGVQLSKKSVPGVRGGSSFSPDGSMATYVDLEIEWTVRAAPSALSPELLARGAHVSRWTLRERDRRLGVAPTDEARTTAMRTVAFVPIAPALLPDETLPPTLPVQFYSDLFREDVAHVLDAASAVDASVLETAFQGGRGFGPQWLRSEAWMMVVCRDDGSAWFGLPPTAVQSPVTNASLICAAMERMLP